MSYLRRVAGLAASALATAIFAAIPAAGHAVDGNGSLTAAVTAKLLSHSGISAHSGIRNQDTRITINRRHGNWAFGIAVLLAPHEDDAHPSGSIFVARADGRNWQVAFDGEPAFAQLASGSPVLSAYEQMIFTTMPTVTHAGGDYRTGMALPFAVGQTWTLTGGPHGWGSGAPFSSIDLAGGDQVVRAARGGAAYTMCQGWVRVIHDRGYSTDYYHLWSNINVNGASVGQGAFLGYTGTDVTCGGSATGRHVHFGLRQNSAYVPIAGHSIGKWVFYSGSAYQGYVMHGSGVVGVGGGVYNYGALGLTEGIVDANGGGSLNRRSGPGTGYAVVGSVADGATVGVACAANGTSHTGRYGTTSLWNRLTDGSWISDAYLWTGLNVPINGWC